MADCARQDLRHPAAHDTTSTVSLGWELGLLSRTKSDLARCGVRDRSRAKISMTHVSRPISVRCTPSRSCRPAVLRAIALGTPEITLRNRAVLPTLSEIAPASSFLLPTRRSSIPNPTHSLSLRGQRERSRCLPESRPSLPGYACSVVSLPPRSLTRLVFASSAGSSSISPRSLSLVCTDGKRLTLAAQTA